MKRALKWGIGLIVGLFLVLTLIATIGIGPANVGRLTLGVGRTYDHELPILPKTLSGTSILIFSKTNGYRDDPQIAAANAALEGIAKQLHDQERRHLQP